MNRLTNEHVITLNTSETSYKVTWEDVIQQDLEISPGAPHGKLIVIKVFCGQCITYFHHQPACTFGAWLKTQYVSSMVKHDI